MGHPADFISFYFLYTTEVHVALVAHGQTLDLKIAPSATKFPRNVAIGCKQTGRSEGNKNLLFYFDPFFITAPTYVEMK